MFTLLKASMTALLTFFATTLDASTFPVGKCFDRACSSVPLQVTWVNRTFDKSTGHATMCFNITGKECVDTKYKCCSQFKTLTNKFVIDTKTKCKDAVVKVAENGKDKRGGVYVDKYDNHVEIRVTNLQKNYEDITTSQFCITTRPPCTNLYSLCMRKGKNCRISFWETADHECCPTCSFQHSIKNKTT